MVLLVIEIKLALELVIEIKLALGMSGILPSVRYRIRGWIWITDMSVIGYAAGFVLRTCPL